MGMLLIRNIKDFKQFTSLPSFSIPHGWGCNKKTQGERK